MARKSEVFDNFIKIAEEKGLLSFDETAQKTKKQLEKNPRTDSLSVEDIARLYNIKPPTTKDMEYERNIVDIAHPNSAVVAPAYDKINGLVENVNQRQDITINRIMNRVPQGQLTSPKLAAQKNLSLSLVRIANHLDNKHQDLYKLADLCLEQLNIKTSAKKTAALPAVALFVIPAALIGGLYLKQHMAFLSDGFQKDSQKLIGEVDDLISSNSNYGVGYTYRPEFIQQMTQFKNDLEHFSQIQEAVENILNQLEAPHDAKELLQVASSPEAHRTVNVLQAFYATAADLAPKFKKILQDFSNESYKQRQIVDKGVLTSVVDSAKIFHGGKGLVADNFDDVRNALETYMSDIAKLMGELKNSKSFQQSAEQELTEAATFTQDNWNNKPDASLAKSKPAEDNEWDKAFKYMQGQMSEGLK